MEELINMEERHYLIISMSELDKVDFFQILQTSAETLRVSVDMTKAIIKWEGKEIPSFISSLDYKEGPLTHNQITKILKTTEWSIINHPYYFSQSEENLDVD
jgi:hypothetical protein